MGNHGKSWENHGKIMGNHGDIVFVLTHTMILWVYLLYLILWGLSCHGDTALDTKKTVGDDHIWGHMGTIGRLLDDHS